MKKTRERVLFFLVMLYMIPFMWWLITATIRMVESFSAEIITLAEDDVILLIVVADNDIVPPGQNTPIRYVDYAPWEALGWQVSYNPVYEIYPDCVLTYYQDVVANGYAMCVGPRKVRIPKEAVVRYHLYSNGELIEDQMIGGGW
jgi:hypothetical protein